MISTGNTITPSNKLPDTKKPTMTSSSSRGAVYNNQQRLNRQRINDAEQVRLAVRDQAEGRFNDTIIDSLAEASTSRFAIDEVTGDIKSIGAFSSIEQFLNDFRVTGADSLTVPTALQYHDERKQRKQQLFEQLSHFSKVGDMKAYRLARAEYSQL